MEATLAQLNRHFWQFEIGGVALPHVKARGKIGRRDGEWRLKVWRELLLFCSADAPERVFAVVAPCVGECDLVAFWRAAVQRGDFGQLHFHSQSLAKTGAEEAGTGFVTLFRPDGIIQTREWCGGDWNVRESISKDVARDWLANSTDELDSPFEFEEDALGELGAREFPAHQRQNQPILWLRGSRAEWKRVLQACATLYFAESATDDCGDPIEAGDFTFYGFAHTPFFVGWFDGTAEGGQWMVPPSWRELLIRHFVFIGWKWTRRKKFPENTRAGWKVATAMISAQIRLTHQPSQHERLEAQLMLRDWLHGKVPAHQIKNLIA